VERCPPSRLSKQTCSFAILRINWDRVPQTRVALYREEDGSCPFIEWFDKLPAKVQDKCYLRLERLREMGHELRRPEADFLRDGIYELRVSLGGVHHRIRSCERAGGPAERDRSRRRAQEAV
jgi:putative component of toxin-antitoxin plasmid stabilization module